MAALRGETTMIEKQFNFNQSEDKVIERIIEDDNIGINHMILRFSEALPEHYSNSNVYMLVIRGSVTLRLNDEPVHSYPAGSMLAIPFKTKMNVGNNRWNHLHRIYLYCFLFNIRTA